MVRILKDHPSQADSHQTLIHQIPKSSFKRDINTCLPFLHKGRLKTSIHFQTAFFSLSSLIPNHAGGLSVNPMFATGLNNFRHQLIQVA